MTKKSVKSRAAKSKTAKRKPAKKSAAKKRLAVKKKPVVAKKKNTTAAKKRSTKKITSSRNTSAKKKSAKKKSVKSAKKKRASTKVAKKRTVKKRIKKANQASKWQAFLWAFFYRSLGAGALATLVGVAGLFYFSRDLPSLTILDGQMRPNQISLLDKNGELITHYGNVYAKPVKVKELPDHVVEAFIATEDRNFYHHWGVNPLAILRALIVNVQNGGIRQGGSTITQQFAKNVFLTPERTAERKIQEMMLAVQLEMNFTKDEILALYLNNVYFGSGAYGLRAASHRYFDKHPSELNLGEAAMLAGLLKAPSKYSPSASPEAARARAKVVLGAMHDAGYISIEERDRLVLGPIAEVRTRANPAPYATDFVMSELTRLYGPVSEDIIVHTTLDIEAHTEIQKAIYTLPERDNRFQEDIQVGLIASERNGAIRVLIGGRDYKKSQYNRVTQARRQPGSAFKPFVYLAAMEFGRQPNDLIFDTPIQLGKWKPENYKKKYYGAVKLSEAMARSLNAAVIRLQEEIGRDKVIAVARRLGYEGKLDPGAALALGVNETTPLNIAKTYLPFANEGYATEPYVITSIYTQSGKRLYGHDGSDKSKVVDQDDLRAMNHMMRKVVSEGSGANAKLQSYVVAGKTGTTQNSRDAWFVGHTAGLVGVVWMGKDDFSPMTDGWSPVSGSGTPSILWKDMMLATLDNRPDIPISEWYPRRSLPSILYRLRNILGDDSATTPAVTSELLNELPVDEKGISSALPIVIRLGEEQSSFDLPEGSDLDRFLSDTLEDPALSH